MATRIIVAALNFASILGLVLVKDISLSWRITVLIVGCACIVYLIYDAIKCSQKNEIVCHNDEDIANTMKKLIKTRGKICIMSRDLSWVDAEMEACIAEKKDNILIFAQKESNLTKRLISKGASVKYYGHLNFEPKTRFTIIRYNSTNPQVAIANIQNSVRRKNSFKHVIYETIDNGCQQDKWINSLALDMMELCRAASVGDKNVEANTAKKT